MRHLVKAALERVPVIRVMDTLRQISEFDRYQASAGLAEAAGVVARAARAAGLSDTGVCEYPADGSVRWWSFRAPVAWTPRTARLTVTRPDRALLAVDHARAPFSVATYSAPVHATLPLVALAGPGACPDVSGAVVVADRDSYLRGGFLAAMAAAGARGFVTDAPARDRGDGVLVPGRIELPPDTGLFAFSLTPEQLSGVAKAARQGGLATVTIDVDRSAAMPVVSAVIPGTTSEEVWLTAHLCHPRPGANDNASGAAALLGVAGVLAAMRRERDPVTGAAWAPRHTIRFLWGPEFLCTAASLHDRRRPVALINLDMVGEDQARCSSPFVVERPAETIPSPLAALAEAAVAEVFTGTSDEPGTWTAEPFLGFSDHALTADPAVGVPSVHFCHPRDRFNHSAADTVDKVAPGEIRRAVAAAAVLARLIADGGMESPAGDRENAEIVVAWCGRETDAARAGAVAAGAWADGLRAHVTALTAAVRDGAPAAWPRLGSDSPVLYRHWEGPLNVRAMTADMPAARRSAVEALVARDKLVLSLLFNFGIRIDGRRTREEIVAHTSYSLRTPLDHTIARQLLDAMVESGWAGPEP
jgi:hypothetical protein